MTLFDFFTAVLGGLCGYWLANQTTLEHLKRANALARYPHQPLPFPWKLIAIYSTVVCSGIAFVVLSIVLSFQ